MPPVLLVLLLLAACDGTIGTIDGRKFLAAQDGPKVPSVQDTLMDTAKNAEKQGDFKQAISLYQQLLEKDPQNNELGLALADAYRRSGQNDQALAAYDELLKRDATMIGAKEGKGLALMAKGDFDGPVPLLEDVMKADPHRWKTLNALGILFTTRNLQSEAQQYFTAALKENPGNVSVNNNMGLSQALARQYDRAVATLTQASALAAPGSLERKRIDMNLSLVYAVSGKMDEARSIAETYYSGAQLNNNLGLYAHLAKDDALAKSYLNMALTDSKVFYEKAWDNLQAIDNASAASPATGTAAAPVQLTTSAPAEAAPANAAPASGKIAPTVTLPKKPTVHARKSVKKKSSSSEEKKSSAAAYNSVDDIINKSLAK